VLLQQICDFYNKWEHLGLKVTFVLIGLQVIHLFWLTHWVLFQTQVDNIPDILFVWIDFLEIPALVTGIVFYGTQIFVAKRNAIYLSFLAVQILHIAWISDEFVIQSFAFHSVSILTYIAIVIDYLELFVVYDLWKRLRSKGK
jgi:hypothetical protein